MPHTAIVILCYNNQHFLQKFLPVVLACSPGAETIIVDNASTDNTLAYLQEHFPEIPVIAHAQNLGFCEGYNQALKQIEADYFVLLNSDVEVTPDWLMPMVALMQQNPSIGACQPKILSYTDRHLFEYAGAGGGFIDSLGYPFCRGRLFKTLETDTGQYDDEIPVFWATGACMLVRAELYKRLGGLEKEFFAHMEEIDLCWRIQRAGYQVYYTGHSRVYHVGGGTLQQDSPRKTFFNFRNNLWLLLRNENWQTLLWLLPARLLLDWLAALQFALQGKREHAGKVLKAQAEAIGATGKWKKWREMLNPNATARLQGVYRGSLVFDYFVRATRTFSGLNIPNRAFFAAHVSAQVHQKGQAQVNNHRRAESEKRNVNEI